MTGFKLYTWTTSCRIVKKANDELFKASLDEKKSNEETEKEMKSIKLAIKMQGGAYMYVNRLGSYHTNLSLDTFFSIKLITQNESVT